MKRRTNIVLGSAFLLLIAGFGYAQNRKQLKSKLERNREQIRLTQKVLDDTRLQQEATLKTLTTFEKQIELREDALFSMNQSIGQLDTEIELARDEISGITSEIERIKGELSEAVVMGYKNSRRVSKLHFIFLSNSFNELLRKINYLERIMEYRRLQLDLIEAKRVENSVKINQLEKKKAESLVLKAEREAEAEGLRQDQEAYEELVVILKNKEQELIREIARRERLSKNLEEQIRKEIQREKNAVGNNTAARESTKEMKGFSPGNLPWPVQNGYVSEHFGRHKHEQLKNIMTENNGINVICEDGAEVQAVYDGVVSAVIKVPGMQTSVLVKHGGYYTVYANLESATCTSGQEISAGTPIGTVGKNQEGSTELHFEVWKGTNKLNPENWLIRR